MPKWTKEQQQVISLRNRNILVSAAAGSGKTAVLVERIIGEIIDEKHPVDIDQLLVVTFTRAAAGEMRKRIGDALESRLYEHPENEHLQRQVSLLHNAQITTIDSFCQNIVRNYFSVIDLDPVFRIADETELTLMKNKLLKELLEEKYQEAKLSFLDFTERFAVGRTDSAIERLVLELYQVAMSYPWPEEWLDRVERLYQCKSMEELESSEWMQELTLYLKRVTEEYMEMACSARAICMDSDGPEMYLPAISSDIEQLASIAKAKSYREYATAFGALNAARLSSKRGEVSPEKKEQVKGLRELYMKGGIQSLKEQFFFQAPEIMLEDIQKLAEPVQELVQVVRDFIHVFDLTKREGGLVDFNDLEHFALNILVEKKEDGTINPSETAKELQEHYYEILTDEYQDSNYVQELILTSLSRAPQQKPYLFMVGDVKQSIYQFRLARPEIFMQKYNSYTLGEGPLQRIDLHKNFRSRQMVLESANLIFSHIMQEKLGGIVYDEAASLVPGAAFPVETVHCAGKTQVLLVERKSETEEEALDKSELEAAVIGRRIQELVTGEKPLMVCEKGEYRQVKYRDIVILLRSPGGWVDEFIQVLSDLGVPAYSETKTGYFSAMEVEIILNLLRVIDNPRQDIPLTAVLSSCLVGLTEEELAAIAVFPRTLNYLDSLEFFWNESDPEGEKYADCCKRMPISEEKVRQLREKVAHFFESLAQYREMAQILSVYEILQKIYQTGYYDVISAMPAGEKRAANLDMLLQQAVTFGQKDQYGIFSFIQYIDSLHKSEIDFGEAVTESENANAVRIMSIHKSKGLEFPVVFVAGLGKMFNMQDVRKSTIIDADYGVGADYLDLELRVKEPALIKRFLANRMKINTLAEEIRVLYVALTRAQEQLILTGSIRGLEKKMEKWLLAAAYSGLARLLNVQTYLDWIMPVLLGDLEAKNLFSIETILPEEVVAGEAEQMRADKEGYFDLKEWDVERSYDEEFAAVLRKQKEFIYPYQEDQRLPVKVSVSELKRLAMLRAQTAEEDMGNESESLLQSEQYARRLHQSAEKQKEEWIKELPRPRFFMGDQNITGAQRGTLYHLVLEHLPYQRIGAEDFTVERYLEDLCQKGYMTQEQAAVIDYEAVSSFLQSSLGQRMAEADSKGLLRREQQFMLGFTAKELYKDSSSRELILVQGIMDAYFEEGDGLVLVDYKTDRVKDAKELVEKYQSQMYYYSQALERLAEKKVREKIIYSLNLCQEIIVPDQPSKS